jgi:hypothetical protein
MPPPTVLGTIGNEGAVAWLSVDGCFTRGSTGANPVGTFGGNVVVGAFAGNPVGTVGGNPVGKVTGSGISKAVCVPCSI